MRHFFQLFKLSQYNERKNDQSEKQIFLRNVFKKFKSAIEPFLSLVSTSLITLAMENLLAPSRFIYTSEFSVRFCLEDYTVFTYRAWVRSNTAVTILHKGFKMFFFCSSLWFQLMINPSQMIGYVQVGQIFSLYKSIGAMCRSFSWPAKGYQQGAYCLARRS